MIYRCSDNYIHTNESSQPFARPRNVIGIKSTIIGQLQFHKKPHKTQQKFQFWQEGFHPKQIQNEAMLKNKMDYIHHNPLERGYIDDPAHWRYSSYRNFMALDAVLPIERLG